MKFTLSWLKEYLETDASLTEIVDAMTMAGLEVESVENPAKKLAAFSVARVISAEPHPDADRLRVCKVETIDGEKQIVCGAPNAKTGLVGIYAGLGTFIPGLDFALDKSPRKIRGIESHGMLCSARELEAGDDHDGIIELAEAFPVGTPAAKALGADDPVIDFEVTPNRPDWLGVQSIARDLAAAGLGTFKPGEIEPVLGQFPCPHNVIIENEQACPAFAARVVRGVKNGPSPHWVQQRLRAIGLRPISALVDITNLMSYDRARPLHVYDLAKLSGPIRVRLGQMGEQLAALDDKTYDVGNQMCAITDDNGVIGIGGLMGGSSTGVDENTKDVLIECALFDPSRTMQAGRDSGITSDARYRFERGVDSDFVLPGMEMATKLVLDWCGGEASKIQLTGNLPDAPAPVEFELSQVKRLSGLSLEDAEITQILAKLGFTCGPLANGVMRVSVPAARRDVTCSYDLVEEIARIHGYDRLPMTSLHRLQGSLPPKPDISQTRAADLRYALAASGYQECITWSFCDREHAALFGGARAELILANPISSELDCMRPSVLVHLLLASARNVDRGMTGLRFFEVGPVYAGSGPKDQQLCAAGIRTLSTERHWQQADQSDVYAIKADVQSALRAAGAPTNSMQVSNQTSPWWHPGRSGAFKLGPTTTLAEFGEIHPGILKEMGVDGPVYGFEVWPDAIPKPRNSTSSRPALHVPDLMALIRDFAFLLAADITAGQLVRAAKAADKTLIKNVSVFDLYEGKGVEPGMKSLAIEVTLQPMDKTLTESEIEAVSKKIIANVEKATGAQLRG